MRYVETAEPLYPGCHRTSAISIGRPLRILEVVPEKMTPDVPTPHEPKPVAEPVPAEQDA